MYWSTLQLCACLLNSLALNAQFRIRRQILATRLSGW